MRRYLFLTIALGILISLAGCKLGVSGSPTVASTTLTPEKQAAMVIEELNDLCPDSYCEGEFDYTFKSLSCVEKSCTVTFSAKHYERKKAVRGSVIVKGLTGEELVENEEGLELVSEAFYDEFTDALIDWEAKHAG